MRFHAVQVFAGIVIGMAGLSLHGAASAQVQFPGNPTSISQCEAAMERATALYMNHSRLQDMYSAQRRQVDNQLSNSCRGSRDFSRCAEPYRQQMHVLYEKSSGHYQEYVRIKGEAVRQNNACRSVAHAHEQQAEQQRRMAEESRRAQERRVEEQRRNAEQNERRVQEENNRREYEARQRQAHTEQLEAQRRQQERNQPRVIAQTNPGYYDNRNAPQVVQTPQTRAAQLQEQQAAAQRQRQQETQALGDAMRNLGEAMGGNTGRTDASGLMRHSAGAAETNAAINAGRGGSPVAGAIGSAGIAAAGARGTGAISTLDQSLAGVSSNVNEGARGGGSSTQYTARTPPSAPRAVLPEPPTQVASAPASPETACGRRVLFALNQCMARECEKPQFKGHPQCRNFEQSAAPRD